MCFFLSLPILICLWSYSFFKRFSATSHVFLGLTESFAPVAGYIAVTPVWNLDFVPLCLFVIFWIAGFDVIYSCQDYEFDKKEGLYSLPVRLGIKGALGLSLWFHGLALLLLIWLGFLIGPTWLYGLGWCTILGLFSWQHSLVSPDDLSGIDKAFFTTNKYISLTLLVTLLLNQIWQY